MCANTLITYTGDDVNLITSLSLMGVKKGQKEEIRQKKGEGRPKARQVWEKFGKWLFLFLIVGQSWLCVSAASEGQQRRTEGVVRMQQEVQIKEHRWEEETSQRWRQPRGEDRIEMKKETQVLMCTLLSGSAWSTEKNT